jgi:hypothetical protein
MGNMMCCSSLEGKLIGEDKEADTESAMPNNDVILMRPPAAINHQVLSRGSSQQTITP